MSELADLLLKSGDLEFDQLESVRGQQTYRGGRLEHLLIESRMFAEKTLVAAISRVTGVPLARLDEVKPDGTALARLPEAFCWDTPCFPVAYDDGSRTVTVAITDPTDIGLADQVIRQSGCRVKSLCAGVNEIRRAVRRHYRGEYVPEDGAEAEFGADGAGAAEEEFKITDMSGNTVMTSLQALKKQHEAELEARGGRELPPPPIASGAAPVVGSASTSIDDLFDIRALSPEETARMEKVRGNVEKSGIILAAILELLEEKGVLSRTEVTQRVG